MCLFSRIPVGFQFQSTTIYNANNCKIPKVSIIFGRIHSEFKWDLVGLVPDWWVCSTLQLKLSQFSLVPRLSLPDFKNRIFQSRSIEERFWFLNCWVYYHTERDACLESLQWNFTISRRHGLRFYVNNSCGVRLMPASFVAAHSPLLNMHSDSIALVSVHNRSLQYLQSILSAGGT